MRFGLNGSFGAPELPLRERLRLMADAGFEAFFCGWSKAGDLEGPAGLCREFGLAFQSVHMEYHGIDRFWHGTQEEAAAELRVQTGCLQECARYGIPLAVQHVYIGFENPRPNEAGVYWFGRLLDEAQRLGLRICFENTEGEACLDRLRAELWDHPAVGFCWDSGHELCYNRGRDMLADFGDRLLATHINDNPGVTGEEICWQDDAHMIPYDGAVDWEDAARRLAKAGCPDVLTLEIKNRNKPGRHTHDRYEALSVPEYLLRIREAAERLAAAIDAVR